MQTPTDDRTNEAFTEPENKESPEDETDEDFEFLDI